jgi:hypothetical protein
MAPVGLDGKHVAPGLGRVLGRRAEAENGIIALAERGVRSPLCVSRSDGGCHVNGGCPEAALANWTWLRITPL